MKLAPHQYLLPLRKPDMRPERNKKYLRRPERTEEDVRRDLAQQLAEINLRFEAWQMK